MAGENKMIVELFTNLFQAFMFITFLYLYFDKPQSKLKRRLAYWGYVSAMFMFCSAFTLTGKMTGSDFYYFDSLVGMLTLVSYSVLFLKGKLYMRIIMPVFAFVINAIISYTFSYVLIFFTGISVEEFFTMSTNSRYTALFVINTATALLLWLVLKLNPKKVQLLGLFEVAAFTAIPLLCTVILYCCMFIYQAAAFSDNILVYLMICCFSMIVIAVLIYFLLMRLSKANFEKTELLLNTQRNKLYEASTLATNRQIEKISNEKHDIKNKIRALEQLIESGSYKEAISLCRETTVSLKSAFTPINTDNPTLNAIINVELEKACSSNIDFTVDIAHNLSFLSTGDTVSLIGNLCDNAIDYLVSKPQLNGKIHLKIKTHINFCIITCVNTTDGCVLKENPQLVTSKEDSFNHGRGLSILRKIAKDHDGDLLINEQDNQIYVSIVLSTN
ncbi:MAG: GHKL domain-containing protein [Ruminococcus sp.]|nr:GHKL domain-containing protein [Ruminococcus sp.]